MRLAPEKLRRVDRDNAAAFLVVEYNNDVFEHLAPILDPFDIAPPVPVVGAHDPDGQDAVLQRLQRRPELAVRHGLQVALPCRSRHAEREIAGAEAIGFHRQRTGNGYLVGLPTLCNVNDACFNGDRNADADVANGKPGRPDQIAGILDFQVLNERFVDAPSTGSCGECEPGR